MFDYNKIMEELAQYKRMQEEITATIDGLQDQIKAYMLQNGLETLTGTEHKASYKPVTSTRLDSTAIKKDLPDIAAQYTKTTTSNRFTFA